MQNLSHIIYIKNLKMPLSCYKTIPNNYANILLNLGGSSNPSVMPEDYASSSASCGVEQIDIRSLFKRPINIAVYGHPYYEVSMVCPNCRIGG